VSKTYTKANYKKAAAGSQQSQTVVDKPVETTSADAATKPRKPRAVVRCYVDVLDQILTKIKPVDWHQLKSVLENIEDRQAFHTIERILKTVDADNWYFFTTSSARCGAGSVPINLTSKLSRILSRLFRTVWSVHLRVSAISAVLPPSIIKVAIWRSSSFGNCSTMPLQKSIQVPLQNVIR